MQDLTHWIRSPKVITQPDGAIVLHYLQEIEDLDLDEGVINVST